jgi:hypothetical protein
MSTWEEREPSCILDITARLVYYPITEDILCQIFGPSTVVEEVFMCNELERAEAQVLFPSKLEAAEPFREFHGQNIFDGYCQMIIKWGIFQDHSTTTHLVSSNTTITMESVHNTTSATATVCQVINIMPSNHRVEVTTSTIFDESIIDEGSIHDEEPVFDEELNNASIDIILSHKIDITEISSPSMRMLLSIVSIFTQATCIQHQPQQCSFADLSSCRLLQ